MKKRWLLAGLLLFSVNEIFAQKGSVFLNGFARIEENEHNWYINTTGDKAFDEIIGTYHPVDSAGQMDDGGHQVIHTSEKEQFAIVRKDGKTGIVTDQGKWLLPPVYDTIELQWEHYLVLRQGDKMTYADTHGKLLLPLKFQDAGILDDDHFDVKENGKWGVYSVSANKLLIPPQYEAFDYCGGCGQKGDYVFAQQNGKWGIINFKNELLIPFAYEHTHYFMRSDDWVQCFKKDGKEVVINLFLKKEYNAPGYTNMEIIGNGLLKAKKKGYYGLTDVTGKIIADFVYDDISSPYGESGSGPFLEIVKNKRAGILREDGKIMIPPAYDGNITCFASCFIIPVNGNYNLLDTSGKKLLLKDYSEITGMETGPYSDTSQQLFKLKQRALYGFYNPLTQKLLPPAFHEIDFPDPGSPLDGLVEVTYLEKKGLYNMAGEQVLPVVFSGYNVLSSGFVAANKETGTGMYDIQHKKEIIPAVYGDVEGLPGDSNLFVVTKLSAAGDSRYGIYNNKGVQVLPPVYTSISETGTHCYLLSSDKNGKIQYDIFNSNNKQLLPLAFQNVAPSGLSGLLTATGGNKTGLVNTRGEVVIPFSYEAVTVLKNRMIKLIKKQADEKMIYGYADSTGKIVVPLVYDYPEEDVAGDEDTPYLWLFKTDEQNGGYKQGLASCQGTVLLQPEYDRILTGKDGQGFLAQTGRQFRVLNNAGLPVSNRLFDDVMLETSTGLGITSVKYTFPLLCREGDNYQYLTVDGKELPLKITEVIPMIPPEMYGIPAL